MNHFVLTFLMSLLLLYGCSFVLSLMQIHPKGCIAFPFLHNIDINMDAIAVQVKSKKIATDTFFSEKMQKCRSLFITILG